MKKTLIALLSCSTLSVFAMTTLDFNSTFYNTPSNFHCNGIKLTPQTTIADLTQNCNKVTVVEHEENNGGSRTSEHGNPMPGENVFASPAQATKTISKVEFYDDNGSYMICDYINNVLQKCKYKTSQIAPRTITKATTPAPVATPTPSITKSTSSAAN
jgi:hypothetical protein